MMVHSGLPILHHHIPSCFWLDRQDARLDFDI